MSQGAAKPMFGYKGRVLHIDLCRGRFEVETPHPRAYENFIGGKGLAGYYLRPHIQREWDDPDLPVCLFTGPLVGTIAPTSGRATLMSRSPLTGTICDSSVGGSLGLNLKRAGYDGLVLWGRAEHLTGVEINGAEIRFTDARPLRGMDAAGLADKLKGQGAVMAVGPAAENGVLFASVMVDKHHAAGRGGLGLCLAAKNLKYLCAAGNEKTGVRDRARLMAAREEILRLCAASPVLMGRHGFSCAGTGALYDLMDSRGMAPTDNFQRTRFESASSLNAHAYQEKYSPKKHGCKGCHILCKKVSKGRAMPEFETMSHFTGLVGNTDLEMVVAANDLCNRMGMDTISAASTLACHREIQGRDLSPDQIIELLTDTALGRGLGKELGQGSLRYARSKGREECSMSVKGLELPAYDPRGAFGMALGYAVSTRGGCHLRGYPISHEILRKPVATDRFSFSGKARMIKIAEDLNSVVDSLTGCKFIFLAASLEEYAKAFSAVTGREMAAQDLLLCGERIYYQERIMNCLNGFDAAQDDLPARFFEEPGRSGDKVETPPLVRKDFLEARSRYYKVRGLDQDARPLAEQAQRLGLEWNG